LELKILIKKSTVAQKTMVSLAKLLRIRQKIKKKYKNIGLEKLRSPIELFSIDLQHLRIQVNQGDLRKKFQ
jgi:hypothetical protein